MSLKPAWRFKYRWIPYDELDKRGVLLAAMHCIRLMNSNFKAMHFYEFKYKTCPPKCSAEFKQKQEKAAKYLEYYSAQIEHLTKRANELGFELPDDAKQVKEMLKTFIEA